MPLPPIPELERLRELASLLPGLDPETVRVVAVLRAAARELDRAAERDLAGARLSEGRLRVLAQLRVADGPVVHSAIAEASGIRPATLTGLVDGLVRDGLAERVADTEDRRRVLLELTDKGGELLDEVLPGHLAGFRAAVEPLSPRERTTLVRLLEKVRAGTRNWKNDDE